jgi:hypothetical protein
LGKVKRYMSAYAVVNDLEKLLLLFSIKHFVSKALRKILLFEIDLWQIK